MSDCVNLWLYLHVIDGLNFAQIARLFGTYYNDVKRSILREYKRVLRANGYKQLTVGRVKRVFGTANAGLVLAYHQCPRCASHSIKLIYEDGCPEGAVCGRCAHEVSLVPSSFSLRR